MNRYLYQVTSYRAYHCEKMTIAAEIQIILHRPQRLRDKSENKKIEKLGEKVARFYHSRTTNIYEYLRCTTRCNP